MLLLEGGHDGHHGFHKAGTVRPLGAKAAFASEHGRPHGPYGGIVCRLDLGVA